MAKTLDKKRDFGTINGDDKGRIYEQDNCYFTGDGKQWVDPDAPAKKETAAEKAAREQAEAAEAARLAEEAKKAEGGGDQLSAQLGT